MTPTDTSRAKDGHASIAAFFDVDNTIIRGASAYHIARGLRRRGFFTRRDVIGFAWEQLKYLVFGETKQQMNDLREEALSIIKGWSVAEMTSIAEDVYDEVLALRIFPGTKKILDGHLQQGHEVWLVTASPVEVGRMIARRLGATGALGTVAEHKRGYYTGALVGDLMHGENKAHAARQLARERDISLAHSYGYGDSLNDVPLLETVGNPCAINPDLRLRRYAKHRGWDLRDFRGRKGNGRRSIAARTTAGALWAFLAVLRVLKRTIVGAIRGSLAGAPPPSLGVRRTGAVPYFLLRRWWRVFRRSLRCFFFDMRLRRFLMTEPTRPHSSGWTYLAFLAAAFDQVRETAP